MDADPPKIHLALPKGRMHDEVIRLLADASIRVTVTARGYRPRIDLPGFEAKILKPRAIVEMLAAGQRDVGFAGADWVAEAGADVVELLDTGLDPVRLVAAAPQAILESGRLPDRELIVASEYTELTRRWIERRGIKNATFLRSYGATEVLPPDDADCIVDNTATGSTLEANGLAILDELMTSSTRLYASRKAMADPAKTEAIGRFEMLIRAVLEARRRVLIELNVASDNLERVVEVLPCMREPTIAQLHHGAGYAVRAAVPRGELTTVIPLIRDRGGTDIVISRPEQIVP